MNKPLNNIYKIFIKRVMDFTFSLIAIVVLSPLLLLITILIKSKLGSPVLFKQKRPGLNERIFLMYKFRTMTNDKDESGDLLPDNMRLTKFGRIFRSTSLDELPELFNILKGDMSFVGPRPQLVSDMLFMSIEQRKRHSVLPGLTGWAQINGRNACTWEEKLACDLEYLNNISLKTDLKIVFMTLIKLFNREEIRTESMNTPEDLGDYLFRRGYIGKNDYLTKLEESKRLLKGKG